MSAVRARGLAVDLYAMVRPCLVEVSAGGKAAKSKSNMRRASRAQASRLSGVMPAVAWLNR